MARNIQNLLPENKFLFENEIYEYFGYITSIIHKKISCMFLKLIFLDWSLISILVPKGNFVS